MVITILQRLYRPKRTTSELFSKCNRLCLSFSVYFCVRANIPLKTVQRGNSDNGSWNHLLTVLMSSSDLGSFDGARNFFHSRQNALKYWKLVDQQLFYYQNYRVQLELDQGTRATNMQEEVGAVVVSQVVEQWHSVRAVQVRIPGRTWLFSKMLSIYSRRASDYL